MMDAVFHEALDTGLDRIINVENTPKGRVAHLVKAISTFRSKLSVIKARWELGSRF
ncbi:hypothetical protein RHIZ_22325 [Rhizobium skierniewicense]|uniref:hypothetical protein n=1 Tax=Rhizobium TaxID=379 RepID=UPI00177DE1A7|nr:MULTISPECIES: hypothetical protein [Rhizobium]MBD8688756.1 hypothetical protein [Rhizobium sp. CFBP 13644]MBD8694017.1 hypothetical protein [Rhizobium sp. CFBP 13717]MCI9868699.1 hypothetical protein [Rhizobium skierniewicense]